MKLRNFLVSCISAAVLTACGGGDNSTTTGTAPLISNTAPVAQAGTAQSVIAGTLVTLDGSTSSDSNNDSLTYKWTLTSKPAGSTATLALPTSAKPTFTPDVAGSYVATLIVNDGQIDSAATSSVTITSSVANAAPVANPGSPQNLVAGTVATLDGSASSDANGDALTYAWSLTAKPAGSAATLASSTSVKPTFTADVAGSYVAQLIVNDGKADSAATTVAITASAANAAPVANAGVAQSVVTGAVVTLNGSTSSDANGDTLTYAWSLTSKPAGSLATLSSPSSAKPTFNADIAGTFVASLVVNDGKVNSIAVTVAITAATANAAPVANAGVAQNVAIGTTVTLDGTASADANRDALTYNWSLTAKPTGSAAALSSNNTAKPTFMADLGGVYVATLLVNDGKINSAATTVSIDAKTAPLPIGAGTFAQQFPSGGFQGLNENTGVLAAQPNACEGYNAADTKPDGRVIAVSSNSSMVSEIDVLKGTCRSLFVVPEPMIAIAVASDGTVVTITNATSFGARQVYRFAADGTQLGKVAVSGSSSFVGIGSLTQPGAIDFAPNGSLYATALGSVWLLDPATGVGVLKAVGVTGSGDIDIDSTGTLRSIDFGTLKLVSTASWNLISSRVLERDIFGFSALVRR